MNLYTQGVPYLQMLEYCLYPIHFDDPGFKPLVPLQQQKIDHVTVLYICRPLHTAPPSSHVWLKLGHIDMVSKGLQLKSANLLRRSEWIRDRSGQVRWRRSHGQLPRVSEGFY